jgi:hypothetical protein
VAQELRFGKTLTIFITISPLNPQPGRVDELRLAIGRIELHRGISGSHRYKLRVAQRLDQEGPGGAA